MSASRIARFGSMSGAMGTICIYRGCRPASSRDQGHDSVAAVLGHTSWVKRAGSNEGDPDRLCGRGVHPGLQCGQHSVDDGLDGEEGEIRLRQDDGLDVVELGIDILAGLVVTDVTGDPVPRYGGDPRDNGIEVWLHQGLEVAFKGGALCPGRRR